MLDTKNKNVKKGVFGRIKKMVKVPAKDIRDVLIAQQHAIVEDFLASGAKPGEWYNTGTGLAICYKKNVRFGFEIVCRKSAGLKLILTKAIENSDTEVANTIKSFGRGVCENRKCFKKKRSTQK